MSISRQLIVALAAIALLGGGMVAVHLGGLGDGLAWGVAALMVICWAWALWLSLSLVNDLRRLGTLCREPHPGRRMVTSAALGGNDLAAIEAALSRNATRYRELTTLVSEGLSALVGIAGGLGTLAEQSATQLSAPDPRGQALAGVKTLALDAAAISGRFDELRSRMGAVTGTARDSAEQIGVMIGATEAMSATITGIAINAEKARDVAGVAVSKVNAASNRVDELGAAALEINKVTDVIVEIAEQTKLLALNATIEAARAGEAGKGFAVVANEVKELALQTNNAIAEIRNKVEAMQHSTDNTIAEIGGINQAIKAVNEIVVTIAQAVEEQSIPTKDIVKQLNQGVKGINGIRETVKATAEEVHETAMNINQIATIAQELADDATPLSTRDEGLALLLGSIQQQSADLQSSGGGLLAKVNALQERG